MTVLYTNNSSFDALPPHNSAGTRDDSIHPISKVNYLGVGVQLMINCGRLVVMVAQ